MKSVGSGGAYGGGGAGASMSSLVNRLHNGQTAATRAKAAEIQVLLYAGLLIQILKREKKVGHVLVGKVSQLFRVPSQKYPTSGY
jgi:hypothetical protein